MTQKTLILRLEICDHVAVRYVPAINLTDTEEEAAKETLWSEFKVIERELDRLQQPDEYKV